MTKKYSIMSWIFLTVIGIVTLPFFWVKEQISKYEYYKEYLRCLIFQLKHIRQYNANIKLNAINNLKYISRIKAKEENKPISISLNDGVYTFYPCGCEFGNSGRTYCNNFRCYS